MNGPFLLDNAALGIFLIGLGMPFYDIYTLNHYLFRSRRDRKHSSLFTSIFSGRHQGNVAFFYS